VLDLKDDQIFPSVTIEGEHHNCQVALRSIGQIQANGVVYYDASDAQIAHDCDKLISAYLDFSRALNKAEQEKPEIAQKS